MSSVEEREQEVQLPLEPLPKEGVEEDAAHGGHEREASRGLAQMEEAEHTAWAVLRSQNGLGWAGS